MTPGRRALLLALGAGAARGAGAQEAGLEALMRAMAAVPRRDDAFTEQKVIPELDLPLPGEGRLRWTAPDRLEKHTTSPFEERLTVHGNRLTYARPDRNVTREIALDDQPELRALVEAVRATLAGDLPGLRRHYAVGFEGSAAGAWRLVLTPVSTRVRAAVQEIRLAGQGAQVLAVDTEGGGGVTRLRIAPLP